MVIFDVKNVEFWWIRMTHSHLKWEMIIFDGKISILVAWILKWPFSSENSPFLISFDRNRFENCYFRWKSGKSIKNEHFRPEDSSFFKSLWKWLFLMKIWNFKFNKIFLAAVFLQIVTFPSSHSPEKLT